MSNLTRRACGLGLAAVLAAGTAFAQTPATQSVVDARGTAIEVPAKPQRIAAISYFATDLAFALGIEPVATTYIVAGREPEYLAGLTKNLKQIGQRAKPNLELLSEAKPDLIIAMKRYTAANAQHLQRIAPFLAYNMELLSESYDEVAQVSKVLGKAERGAELNAAFKKNLAEFVAKAPAAPKPRFQIMWGGDTPFTFHTENTAASIVAALGGDNIAGPMTQGGRFGISLSLEAMLEKNPEVIFVVDYGPDRPHENNPIWKQLSAVKNGRVHYVSDEWVETNGPIARELVLREAAHYLYPNVFPAVDVKAEAAKIIPAALRK